MDKYYDVTALGELLVDFTENGKSSQGNGVFEACPGGAPCNVLAMLRKLDRKCAFIGKVGNDMFGRMLKDTIESIGIDTRALVMDDTVPTTLAFVKSLPGGERDFSFYRNPGADMMLSEYEIPAEMLGKTRIFHFGTLSMTHQGVRTATEKAVSTAKEAGAIISFDPNIRPPLWADISAAIDAARWGLGQCDVLKISDDELELVTGDTDIYHGAEMLHKQYPNIRIINVTAGEKGSYSFYGKEETVFVPACSLGGVIDTTGAGDTFCACVLDFILKHGIDGLDTEQRRNMLWFANFAAYLVTTEKGALRSMPEAKDVITLLESIK